MAEAGADVMLFGHTHKPYHKALAMETEAGGTVFRHAVNTGSVGKPKDGSFWMRFDAFLAGFNKVYLCYLPHAPTATHAHVTGAVISESLSVKQQRSAAQ